MIARGWIVLAASALACSTPVDGGDPVTASLVGTWSFAAAQTGPTLAQISGTLEIQRHSSAGFDGRLDVVEVQADGQSRRASGIVSGRLIDDATRTVDFDAFLGTGARRHVGTLSGDTLRGTWVEPTGAGAASGSFTAARRR